MTNAIKGSPPPPKKDGVGILQIMANYLSASHYLKIFRDLLFIQGE